MSTEKDQKKAAQTMDMTRGEPRKLLILFAIPMILGGIFQLLYNTVDTIVVGRFVSEDALAAIGATSTSTLLINVLGNSFTNAITIITSQAEGASLPKRIRQAMTHSVYMVTAVGLILGLVSFFGARPFMRFLGCDPTIIDLSVLYLRIVCGLTIFSLWYQGSSALLRGIGDSKTPLYFLIFSSVLNVVLDLVFVLLLKQGVAGVGWATVISQAVSALICTVYMFRRYPRLRPQKGDWKTDFSMIRDLIHFALPMMIQESVLTMGMFVITAVINSFGKDTVAAYAIGSRVESLAAVAFSRLAFAFSVYTGQNFGARRYDRIKEGLRKGIPMVAGLAILSSAIVLLFARELASLFLSDSGSEALVQATDMIRMEAMLYIALGIIYTLTSTLRGIGVVHITLVSGLFELISKIGCTLLLSPIMGTRGIWLAAPLGWVLGILPSLVWLIWWSKNPEKHSVKYHRVG